MNTRKPFAVFAAMLITTAGMVGIANYSNAAADSAHGAIDASAAPVVTTLPVTNVQPTREQLRALRDSKAGDTGSASATSAARMPYYSFASDQAGA